jgi:signal transduction histidine kinase
VDNEGIIQVCNRAAEELLDVAQGHLLGRSIRAFLPTLADAVEAPVGEHAYRTALNCRGRRATGKSFQASAWFASYPTAEGTRLAAIVTDMSEDLRESRETSLESLLRSTRVLVGSVSHEIRNMCAAIAIVHANLGRLENVRGTEDYSALGTLADGLTRLATIEMTSANDPGFGAIDLASLSDEFRIVIEPALAEASASLVIGGFDGLPSVKGDYHSMLQVMLNLARNSIRAMEDVTERSLSILASEEEGSVLIRFSDSGPGIQQPVNLFQAFQHGADAVGLGLFISRALVRSSGGDLFHEPTEKGCTMCIRLAHWLDDETPRSFNFSELHA